MAFETDESVLFIEVPSIQRCPDRKRKCLAYRGVLIEREVPLSYTLDRLKKMVS